MVPCVCRPDHIVAVQLVFGIKDVDDGGINVSHKGREERPMSRVTSPPLRTASMQ
jgi:hypothetical protein